MRTLVFDVAATEGGALTILESYHKKALLDTSNYWVFVISTPILKKTENIEVLNFNWVKKSWFHRLFFDYVTAPLLVKKYMADSILSLQNTTIPRTKIPVSIYFHQTVPLSKIRFKLRKNPKLWLYQNVVNIFIANSLKKADKVIVQSQWIADSIHIKWGINRQKITIQSPVFETDKIYTKQTKKPFKFIYPAAPYDYKNHIVIIKALNLLKNQSPKILDKIHVSFTITGRENRYAQSMYALAKSQQLPIDFLGPLSHNVLLTEMAQSILIFPSKLESFGLPLLEAKTIGAPIIASDQPFSRDILSSYRRGCYFETDDWQSLARCLKNAVNDQLIDTKGALIKIEKILLIGGMYDRNKENEYLSKSSAGIQGAVNAHQWSIAEGLSKQPNVHVEIISAPFLDTYPKYREIHVKPHDNGNFHGIGYINLPIVREILRIFSLSKKVRNYIKETPDAKVMCYYLALPQILSSIFIRHPITKTLVIPDVPSYLNLANNVSFTTKFYGSLKKQMLTLLIQRFDKYIILTKHMAEILKLRAGSWLVIEALLEDSDIILDEAVRGRSFANLDVVYSGSLHEIYGVKNLADAASLVKNRAIQFYFYGTGELSDYLKDIENKYQNIHYMGYVSRDTVIAHQRTARALINPRGPDGDYVWYSFPSKNLEYLASGTPAIFMDLPCIPSEYSPHYIHLDNNSAQQIADTLDSVAEMKEADLKLLALGAAKFTRGQKSAKKQSSKIINFITEQ